MIKSFTDEILVFLYLFVICFVLSEYFSNSLFIINREETNYRLLNNS